MPLVSAYCNDNLTNDWWFVQTIVFNGPHNFTLFCKLLCWIWQNFLQKTVLPMILHIITDAEQCAYWHTFTHVDICSKIYSTLQVTERHAPTPWRLCQHLRTVLVVLLPSIIYPSFSFQMSAVELECFDASKINLTRLNLTRSHRCVCLSLYWPYLVSSWPWTLTFCSQNLISSSLSPAAVLHQTCEQDTVLTNFLDKHAHTDWIHTSTARKHSVSSVVLMVADIKIEFCCAVDVWACATWQL